MNGIIRKAKIKDAESLSTCMNLAYSAYLDRMDASELPPIGIDYQKEIEHYPVWVIKERDEVIAGLILVFEDKTASIANIAVHPRMQGKGLGHALITFAEKEAMSKGYKDINLTTHVLLKENIAYYKKQRYTDITFAGNKVHMVKKLENNRM